MFDLETIRMALDTGLGAVALLYAHRVARLLDKHDTRISRLERRPKPKGKTR